jgi:hypothetical protein
MKSLATFITVALSLFLINGTFVNGQVTFDNRQAEKIIVFGNSRLKMMLDYDSKCIVGKLDVNGEQVLRENSGIFSSIRMKDADFSTRVLNNSPEIRISKNKLTISKIKYGLNNNPVSEVWTFIVTDDNIKFDIERTITAPIAVEEVSFPCINYKSINTWEGAFPDFGGIAWFYLFNEKPCAYGVHSASSVFWNSKTGNGLKVSVSVPGKQVVSKFSRTNTDMLEYALTVSDQDIKYRYQPGINRSRFIRKKTDVWDSFTLSSGKYIESVNFSWVNYREEYNRGYLAGLNGNQVTNLLNTAARIGVIDARLFGGNSWHTPYGPICLHEQYIAELGVAINDPLYLEGYKKCLDNYRDNAIQPDGRVLARWAYLDIDAMPGKMFPRGFYEAQWGYLLDSNPDFVTNVSELYQQNGDINWVRGYKSTCEKALDYMLKRDSNGNHLVEMINSDHSEKKSSDWIDIVWASFENAFVNAKLYYALTLWSEIERQVGDIEKAAYYSDYALKLKTSFNKPTSEGGFWDIQNRWYVHWLDKDKSVHGNNLVVPVNFMAVAYGICDDVRRKAILDKVEAQMQMENLFAWPICLYSYEKDEARENQFPFPFSDFLYENGDIFLSWGSVGVKAYASYKPELALKYIENILSRYEKDGLAFQRYGRLRQVGFGDDILAGNSLAIVGLYKSIYGINPMPNRLYLDPHLPERISGTTLNYNFRGDKLIIGLEKDKYSIANDRFKLLSKSNFGFNSGKNELEYYNLNSDTSSLKIKPERDGNLTVEILDWNEKECVWNQVAASDLGKINYLIQRIKPGSNYEILVNGRSVKSLVSDQNGNLQFTNDTKSGTSVICLRSLNR